VGETTNGDYGTVVGEWKEEVNYAITKNGAVNREKKEEIIGNQDDETGDGTDGGISEQKKWLPLL